jgi:malate dehydrogenase (oxaloacetate-decarboxylating)
MNTKPIIFALANPTPEISPEEAKKWGAFIVATWRWDYPNQVNNVLVFPGIFRGALDARLSQITDKHAIIAAHTLASCVKNLTVDSILPTVLQKDIVEKIAKAIIEGKE